MADSQQLFDRALLRRRLARQAPGLAARDFLSRLVARDLAERLEVIQRRFPVAAEIGARGPVVATAVLATGKLGALTQLALVSGLEPAPGAVLVVGDEELLPLAGSTLDLALSALSLHLVNDLPGALIQIRRALKPDGLLLAAVLGGRTLEELRQVFVIAEAETAGGVSPRVIPFADVRDLGDLLQRAGFALPVTDSQIVTVTYTDALALMRELQHLGWSNVLHERRPGPLGRRLLQRVVEIYGERFSAADGRIRATFEIVTLTGWAPHESQQKPLRPGSARRRLADALGTTEQSAGEATGPGPER